MLEIEHALRVGMIIVAENNGDLSRANQELMEKVALVLGVGVWDILLAEYEIIKNQKKPLDLFLKSSKIDGQVNTKALTEEQVSSDTVNRDSAVGES